MLTLALIVLMTVHFSVLLEISVHLFFKTIDELLLLLICYCDYLLLYNCYMSTYCRIFPLQPTV